MRFKIFLPLLALMLAAPAAVAQTPADTVYAPPVLYTAMPRTYEIAGIEI